MLLGFSLHVIGNDPTEIDFFDPYPETSGGLVSDMYSLEVLVSESSEQIFLLVMQIRPFELLALGR